MNREPRTGTANTNPGPGTWNEERFPCAGGAAIDWRDADAATIERCYARERTYWRDVLAWDSTWTWTTVEQARQSRLVPGFVLADADGNVRGWSFHILDGRTLRIGGLVADDPITTGQLVDLTLGAARAAGATAVACFITSRASGLADALAAHGAVVESFHYLAAPPGAPLWGPASGAPGTSRIECWDGDVNAASDLLTDAYAPGAAIHFAADGRREDWQRYVRQIVEQHGCGTIDRKATLMMRDARGLAALALVTSLAPTTAHLAQLAVRGDCRGGGVARRLLRAAAAEARAQGRTTMTLLVGDGNHAARRLYANLGFAPRAGFIAARLAVR